MAPPTAPLPNPTAPSGDAPSADVPPKISANGLSWVTETMLITLAARAADAIDFALTSEMARFFYCFFPRKLTPNVSVTHPVIVPASSREPMPLG